MFLTFRRLNKKEKKEVSLSECALILSDAWDTHWCSAARIRLESFIEPINKLFRAARKGGILICHSPGGVTKFYKGRPARKRVQGAPDAKLKPKDLPKIAPLCAFYIDRSELSTCSGMALMWPL